MSHVGSGVTPELDALAAFLRASVDEDGSVRGWRSGFAYPEIGGYLLQWLTQQREPALAERVARWLATTISPRGGVGRDGHDYLFDSAIVLDGLALAGAEPEAQRTLQRFIRENVQRSKAVVADEPLAPRWSTTFSPHLLKLALVLRPELFEDAAALRARLPRPAKARGAYLHAHAYALEGLLVLAGGSDRLRDAVDELASLQREDGGMGDPVRADATAQAVRLWVAVDALAFATPIERGLRCLAGLQGPGGGMRYGEESEDLNVWCTLFAHQALSWARAGHPTTRLI